MGAAARRQRDAAPVPLFALRHTTVLRSGPVAGRPYFLCLAAYNRSGARTAILSLPCGIQPACVLLLRAAKIPRKPGNFVLYRSLFHGAWPPRPRINPTGGIRRHLPLHKGGFLCPSASGQPFLYHLAPTGPRREARKGSGKNLVFPRGTAAASPNDLQVILALCQNNTPPMAQEGPGGFRRREETWGSLPRREGSAPISPGVPFPFWRFRLPLP